MHGCGLFPDVDELVGHDGGVHAVLRDSGTDAPDDAGPIVDCRFGSNAVPLRRATTRAFSWFGLPVAADGSTIVVGAPLERDPPYATRPTQAICGVLNNTDAAKGSGMVRVYEAAGGDWLETQLTLDGIELSNPIVPNGF